MQHHIRSLLTVLLLAACAEAPAGPDGGRIAVALEEDGGADLRATRGPNVPPGECVREYQGTWCDGVTSACAAAPLLLEAAGACADAVRLPECAYYDRASVCATRDHLLGLVQCSDAGESLPRCVPAPAAR